MKQRTWLIYFPLLIILLVGCFPGCQKETPRKNFILVSLDTVRLDRLSLHGNKRNVSPKLVELSKKGLVFDQALTVTENTLISHASMLTGLYPAAHAATHENGGVSLADSYQTIAEDFLNTGEYQTAGFTTHGTWLNRKFGFHQGFQVFSSGFRSADVVLKEVKQWLKEKRDPKKPYFLFIHLFDAHSDWDGRPYQTVPPFLNRWTSGYQGRLQDWENMSPNGSIFLAAVNKGRITLTQEDILHIRDQYDEGLAYTDDRICDFLEENIDLDDTYVVITADHGEEFKDHDYMLHSSLYDQVVRVPLIVIPPGNMAKKYKIPRRIPDQVRIVDLRPTILDMAGIDGIQLCQGKDLNPWMLGREKNCPAGPAPFYHRALRWEGYKLYKRGENYELYDLTRDPAEKVDLIGNETLAARVRKMKAIIQDYARKDRAVRKIVEAMEKGGQSKYSQKDLEKLRSLGYL